MRIKPEKKTTEYYDEKARNKAQRLIDKDPRIANFLIERYKQNNSTITDIMYECMDKFKIKVETRIIRHVMLLSNITPRTREQISAINSKRYWEKKNVQQHRQSYE